MKLSIKLNLLQIGSRQLTPECKVCLLFASKQEKLMTCRNQGDVGRLTKYVSPTPAWKCTGLEFTVNEKQGGSKKY